MKLNFKVVLGSAAILVALLFLFGFTATPASSQQSSSPENWSRYNVEKKGEIQAAAIEAFIPVLGHAYAGDASKGFIPAAVSVGGLVVMFSGASSLDTSMMSLGYLGYMGGRVWGIVSAYQTAGNHNSALRQELGLAFAPVIKPSTGAVGFQLSLSTR